MNRYAHLLLLFGLFLVTEILVNPTGEFPLNDDCTYTKATLLLVNEGQVNIGPWPAMTLLTNMVWGGMFVKTFGFSFFILRLSTLIVAFTGIVLLFVMIRRSTGNASAAMGVTLTMAFNPYFVNLSNTFMTDVNFTVLLIAGIYTIERYMRLRRPVLLLPLLLCSLLLVFLRQYGIVLPLGFVLVSAVYPVNRLRNIAVSSVVLGVILLALWLYEKHLLQVLEPGAAYKYVFGGGDTDHLAVMKDTFATRLPTTFVQLFMFILPVALMALPRCFEGIGWRWMLVCLAASLLLHKYFFADASAILPNIISNINLGPDTFFEVWTGSHGDHTHIQNFDEFLFMYKPVSTVLSCCAILAGIVLFFREKNIRELSPLTMMLWLQCGTYMVLLMVTPSYFDRYHLPLIVMVIILLGRIVRDRPPLVTYVVILVFALFSIGGTGDYLALNRARWEAYNHLTREMGVPPDEIQSGFETACWDADKHRYLFGADVLDEHQRFMIQYSAEEHFVEIKSFPFRRYLFPRHDTIKIFQREP